MTPVVLLDFAVFQPNQAICYMQWLIVLFKDLTVRFTCQAKPNNHDESGHIMGFLTDKLGEMSNT
jgi:hypothetical protein